MSMSGRSGAGIFLALLPETHRILQLMDARGMELGTSEGFGEWHAQVGPGLFIVQGMLDGEPFSRKIIVP